ncbi:ATP-binding cassette domain-containing protein [Streptococcus sp. 20-1249]|uniref:ATP-binding cassette domain-containing protein n=1 Tax=Streptococcus hepaticus TaxID=3349163 RepID=UPI0037492440
MLQLKHLTMIQEKDLHTLVENLSATIQIGDKLAIIGEEGTGKSSLLQVIYNPNLVTDYLKIEGEIINHFSSMAYLPQLLPAEEANKSLSDFIFDDLDYTTFDFNLLYQLAGQLQFDSQRLDNQEQTVCQLSGGEKIKIQLLKVLAGQSDLLLLDEPSSDLDMETIIWLEDFIQQSPLTIIFISHDEELLKKTATKLIHLEQIKKGSQARSRFIAQDYQSYQEERQAGLIRQEQLARKEREEQADRLQTLHQTKSAVRDALVKTKNDSEGRLLAKKMKNLLSRENRYLREAEQFTELPDNPDTIGLFFDQIDALPAQKVLLDFYQEPLITGQEISLTILGQEKLAITGQNGVGKTLLLKKIKDKLSQNPHISLGYMPQDYVEELKPDCSTLEFLAQQDNPERARTLLASIKFTRQEVELPISQLSGGQKAKLFLAKMVYQKNNVIILDEPSRHFSPTAMPEIYRLLENFSGCLITVPHDRHFIENVCSSTYRLTASKLEKLH